MPTGRIYLHSFLCRCRRRTKSVNSMCPCTFSHQCRNSVLESVYVESCRSVSRPDLCQPEHRQFMCKIPAQLKSLRTSPCRYSPRIEFLNSMRPRSSHWRGNPISGNKYVGSCRSVYHRDLWRRQRRQCKCKIPAMFTSPSSLSCQRRLRIKSVTSTRQCLHSPWCALNVIRCNSIAGKSEIDISSRTLLILCFVPSLVAPGGAIVKMSSKRIGRRTTRNMDKFLCSPKT